MAKENVRTRSKKKQALAFMEADNLDEARPLYERICQIDPLDAESWFQLGIINKRQGNLHEAETCLRRALALRPDSAGGHFHLAIILETLGQYDAALTAYREALQLVPMIEAYNNLGNVLSRLGRHEEALANYRAALNIRPDYFDAHYNLGNQLAEHQRFAEAIPYLEQASSLKPDARTLFNLGNAYFYQSKFNDAVTSYSQALRFDSRQADLYMNLGTALGQLGNIAEAIACYSEALKIRPDDVEVLCNVGELLITDGRLDESLASFQRALQVNPSHSKARAGEVKVYDRLGDFDRAYAALQPLLDGEHVTADAALAYASLCRHIGRCDDAIDMMERALSQETATPSGYYSVMLNFELGRLLDAAGNYDRAFEYYRRGNALKGMTFSTEEYTRHIDDVIATYNREFLEQAPRIEVTAMRPLFIVGMPRSGTSLVEQILASHPQIAGGGELKTMNDIVIEMPALLGTDLPYPQCLSMLTAACCASMHRRYLDRLAAISPDAAYVTDKMPANFKFLGLIALLFPGARIIHCIRDPLDTCLSCYFQHFSGGHDYAYDLENLGSYYRQYQRLMAHWRSVLTLPMLEVRYEDLVSDQERVSRDLIAFCDLPWDERCLRFHETVRSVETRSYDQVRQPLYQRSVGRWRHYERFLEPLKRRLHGEG